MQLCLIKAPQLPGGQQRRRRDRRLPRVHARADQPPRRRRRQGQRADRPPVPGDGRGLERLVRPGLPDRRQGQLTDDPHDARRRARRRLRQRQHHHRASATTRSTATSPTAARTARARRPRAPAASRSATSARSPTTTPTTRTSRSTPTARSGPRRCGTCARGSNDPTTLALDHRRAAPRPEAAELPRHARRDPARGDAAARRRRAAEERLGGLRRARHGLQREGLVGQRDARDRGVRHAARGGAGRAERREPPARAGHGADDPDRQPRHRRR